MSPSAHLRSVVRGVGRAALRRAAPPEPDDPIDGGLGPSPLGPPDLASTAEITGHLGALALRAGSGDTDAAEIARVLDHADITALKGLTRATALIHLAATWSWATLDPPTGRRLAGQARAAAGSLVSEGPADGPDAVAAHAALAIAGHAWPALPRARAWRGQGLARLAHAMPGLLSDDGAPLHDPGRTATALWAVALARAWARAGRTPFPRAADAALVAGSLALWRLGGDDGRLPPCWGARPPARDGALLPLGTAPLPHTLRNLVLAWSLDGGEAASADDPACRRLAGTAPVVAAPPMAGPRWQLYTWRETGVAAAHRSVAGQPALAWWAGGRFGWRLGELLVVADRSEELDPGLVRARVDGDMLTLAGADAGTWQVRQAALSWRGPRAHRTWQIDGRWALQGGPHQWTGRHGDLELVLRLDPGTRWTVRRGGGLTPHTLHGRGGQASMRLEIRRAR